MLTLPSSVKIFIYTQPTDMRCGFGKLSMLAESFMQNDPFSGHLFVFFNKYGDKCKILFWEYHPDEPHPCKKLCGDVVFCNFSLF